MVKKPWINHLSSNDVSPVANLLTLFIILTSSNECMAYLTSVLFTIVSIIYSNKSFYCVIGFDIIQALPSSTMANDL